MYHLILSSLLATTEKGVVTIVSSFNVLKPFYSSPMTRTNKLQRLSSFKLFHPCLISMSKDGVEHLKVTRLSVVSWFCPQILDLDEKAC
jgi:hypothetical protein